MASRSMPKFEAAIGYRLFYRPDHHNVCPCCHKANWHVGRLTAECAFCATALPIDSAGWTGIGLFHRREVAPAEPLLSAA